MNVAVVGHSVCLPGGFAPGDAVPADGDWFDVKERLGRRGYRQLPLPAQLTLAAVRGLVPEGSAGDAPDPGDEVPAHRRGVWLGSSTAAAHCLAELDRRILAEGTESLPPTGAPYFSVNLVPARAVNELGATGPSVTVTSTGTAVLDAVACAVRALRLGHVDEAIVVAVEVPDEMRADGAPAECGAIALRLRAGESGGLLRSSSAFVAGEPATAAERVHAGLASQAPVLVAGPGGAAPGGPLAAFARLVAALRAGDDLAVVLTDATGAASGVDLAHAPVAPAGTAPGTSGTTSGSVTAPALVTTSQGA
ncbi:beta-ketoacyl synthase N-terminal-like domain-containing protein [Myceligenerans crystallogenes]|uniref:Beta-ketoacyl synthase-like N-terminal domain-containing protein n=1 Tax=Myceligenerans crystallogenes TaxID=316335 RepID=A0ABN2NG53_9MICO